MDFYNNLFFLSFVLIFLTFFSAFLSSTEIAFFSLPNSKIRGWKNSPHAGKRRVYGILSHSRHLLVLIFMLNTIVNVILQNVSSEMFDTLGLSFFGKIILPLVLILFFGELLPKWIGMVYNEKIALYGSYLYPFLIYIHKPLQKWVTEISEFLSRVFFFFLKPIPGLSIGELEEIVTHAVENKILQPHEALLISNWIDLDHKTAHDLMTPRSLIRVIPDSKLNRIQQELAHSYLTPLKGIVIGKCDDLPIGFLRYQNILLSENFNQESLIEHAKKQFFYVPDTTHIRKLIKEFENKKEALACIIDEHDMVLGYIQFEDIEERLLRKFGNHDTSKNISNIQVISPYSIIVEGSTPLEIINHYLQISLESLYRSTTINGWFIEQYDSIPTTGTSLIKDNIVFRVIFSTPIKIEKIFIQKHQETALFSKKREKRKRIKK